MLVAALRQTRQTTRTTVVENVDSFVRDDTPTLDKVALSIVRLILNILLCP